MKTIHKFRVQEDEQGRFGLRLPRGATVLTVQEQYGKAQLWALIDTDEECLEDRTFCIHPTGHEVPENPGEYIGTFQMLGGMLVFHLFEEPRAVAKSA